MSNPSKRAVEALRDPSCRPRLLDVMVVAGAMAVLMIPVYTQAGIVDPDAIDGSSSPAVAVVAVAEPNGEPRGEPTYNIRCWQFGRLLFEENGVSLPADIASAMKLRGTDRNKMPVYVTETRNATCLIRSARPVRGR